MKKLHLSAVVSAMCLIGAHVPVANAQDSNSIGSLLEQGFEIKGVAAADLEPGEGAGADNVFVILQRENVAFGCVLRSINSSFCQRMQ